MDPDMVRQQAEAEREAMALRRKMPAGPVPASAATIPHAVLTAAAEDAAPAAHEQAVPLVSMVDASADAAPRAGARLPAEAAPEALAAIVPEVQALKPQAEAAPWRKRAAMAARLGRFVSFGVAGAMLGGGLGIFAASYLQLQVDLARLAVFGPAAFFAGVCAIASLYAKTAHE